MGEKEQRTAREASSPSVSERKSGSVIMQDRAAEENVVAGDPDFDTARASNLATGLDDDADARKTVTKTSSNIQNNREDVPDGFGAGATGPVRLDPTPARFSEGGGNDIAIGDPGVNGN